ncbi:competence type IV pilus minor pilin ComGF [Metasolibacillus meyeri]|uniref:competence type IV pilus minor pilin ComGF n=1 Tax=Metasolibacillus meyeri TaxID=1071052 RepID=UPI000D322983|nr:competence type IV pilus minor pilin ComGF [Metasolibacillus meyeri]
MHRLVKMMKNQRGFTFLEALFQLVALLLLAKLLLLMILYMSPLYQNNFVQEAAWEMFIVDLQNFMVQADEVAIRNGGAEILIAQGNIRRSISKSNETIRMRLNAGNEILFVGIQSLNFRKINNELVLNVELTDGTIEERTFIVPSEK